MAASATLKCLGRKHSALFVGQWAAPILIMGLYNKMVKTRGTTDAPASRKGERGE